jgi:hypothetical protein
MVDDRAPGLDPDDRVALRMIELAGGKGHGAGADNDTSDAGGGH